MSATKDESRGTQSISTLPANRSIILADSRYRENDDTESPYHFTCNLSGTGIYAKEIYYQKLYWGQPLFSHRNDNCELRFQINGNDTNTFVVYVTPFLIFKEYDGNPPGTSLLPPQPYSYAANMEMGLNGDVRNLLTNTTLINGDGKLRDSNGNIIVMCFRYSPTRGFCIYPVQPNPILNVPPYSIRLLPCSYIQNAHYVHGFGVYNFNTDIPEYEPVSMWSAAYWSDNSPSLLPFRYIVITSLELNKDRRMISFHNGNYSNFVNELALFPLNCEYSGAFHEDGVGDDATVIPLRDEYKPQRFVISIMNEFGNILECDDPVRNLLLSGLPNNILNSFYSTNYLNRGNSIFMDLLVFGSKTRIKNQQYLQLTGQIEQILPQPLGQVTPFQTFYYVGNQDGANAVPAAFNLPIVLKQNQSLTPLAAQIWTGFSAEYIALVPYTPPGILAPMVYTQFTWYQQFNPFPAVAIDLNWDMYLWGLTNPAQNPFGGYSIVMFDAEPTDGAGTIQYSPLMYTNLYFNNVKTISTNYGSAVFHMMTNQSYNPPQKPTGRKVGFSLSLWTQASGVTISEFQTMYPFGAFEPNSFVLANPNDTANIQTSYNPPKIEVGGYGYGNPLADGMCEEVIHEIAAILEYS